MFDEMEAFTNLLDGGSAAVLTALIAVASVSVNLYGGLLTERKRADLAKQVERDRQAALQVKEMRSLVARYRGPLLEAAVDLENRLVTVATGRTARGGGRGVVEEEVLYTLFTIAQFLGFVEIVRREGPRERSFLQQGNPQGTDTLATLVEGFRFILCAHSSALQAWFDEGDTRDHPGARSRPAVPHGDVQESVQSALARAKVAAAVAAAAVAAAEPASPAEGNGASSSSAAPLAAALAAANSASGNGVGPQPVPSSSSVVGVAVAPQPVASTSGGGGAEAAAAAAVAKLPLVKARVRGDTGLAESWPGSNVLRMSRGTQRAVGSMMIITPVGASRHYTLSYSDFYRRYYSDPAFAAWLKPVFQDLVGLIATPGGWPGTGPFPMNSWSRLLLLQQLLVDTIDLLDPFWVRTPEQHRLRLAPVTYVPLPNAESYKERLEMLESLADSAPAMNSVFLRVGWVRSARDGHSNEYLGSNDRISERLYWLSPGQGGGGAAAGQDGAAGAAGAAGTAGGQYGPSNSRSSLARTAYERGAAGLSYSSMDEADMGVGLPYDLGGGAGAAGAGAGPGRGGPAGPVPTGPPLGAGAFVRPQVGYGNGGARLLGQRPPPPNALVVPGSWGPAPQGWGPGQAEEAVVRSGDAGGQIQGGGVGRGDEGGGGGRT
ncbi:hypothetical protein HYH03_008778 [Edaphochlamys debaryana]|uniref:Uncharacterized protein n=1 Tax=Edaphochlamys debaryana TaxID=47281 RepID=A0A835Y603_9CHLO|nr:hypothetical protein HYH03_008778 [Edaphochlamys debaryana]|eukprot:KAG2493115.1 hypothetical protein HYH03_008778 [Edaphochlamys debaryana]